MFLLSPTIINRIFWILYTRFLKITINFIYSYVDVTENVWPLYLL